MGLAGTEEGLYSLEERRKEKKCKRVDGTETGVQTRALHLANHPSISLGLNLQLQPRTIIDILTVRVSVLGCLYARFVIGLFYFSS